MYIDISVEAGVITGGIVNRLMATPICLAEDLASPFANSVVERVTFDNPSIRPVTVSVPVRLADGTTVTTAGHRVRLTVTTHVFLATLDDVRTAGVGGAQTLNEIPFDIQFDLSGELQIDSNGMVTGAGVRTTYVSKDIDIPNAELDARVETRLAAEDQFGEIDLGAISEALGRNLAILNVGVALTADASAVVIRVEIDSISPNPVTAWSTFFAAPPNLLGGRSWAVLIDKLLMTSVAEERFATGLAESATPVIVDGALTTPSIAVLETPNATWPGAAQVPAVLMTAYIDVIDACPNELNIGAELFVSSVFSLVNGPEGNQLQTDIVVSWNLIDSDVLLCGITSGLFVAPVSTLFGGGAGMSFAIGAFIGTTASIVGIAIAGDLYEPDSGIFLSQDPEECVLVTSDEDHAELRCLNPLNFPDNPLIGPMNPNELLGHARGLLLRGTVVLPTATKHLTATITPLGWDRRLNCGTRNLDTTQLGSIELMSLGSGPLTVCRRAFEQNDGYFEFATPNTLRIATNAALQAAYTLAPYPCRVMVWTTQGVRFFDLGIMPAPPAPPAPEERIAAVLRNCIKAHDQFWRGRFNPKWRIDPPPDAEVLHHWEVSVTGLLEGDRLELLGRDGGTFASVRGTRAGAARATAMTEPAEGELVIARRAGHARDVKLDPDIHRLAITQRLLVLERQMGFAGKAREIVAYRGAGNNQIAVLTNACLHAWTERSNGAVAATLHLMDSDITHIAAIDGGVAAVRSDGVLFLRPGEDGRLNVVSRFAASGIADITTVGDALVLLTSDRLSVLDRQFRLRAEMPFEGGISVSTVMGHAAVRAGRGTQLALFHVSAQHEVRVGPVRDIAVNTHLADGGRVVGRRSASDGWPELQIESSGWMDTVVRFGQRWAILDRDGHRLAIYRVTETLAG
jgi:hypothetical protein